MACEDPSFVCQDGCLDLRLARDACAEELVRLQIRDPVNVLDAVAADQVRLTDEVAATVASIVRDGPEAISDTLRTAAPMLATVVPVAPMIGRRKNGAQELGSVDAEGPTGRPLDMGPGTAALGLGGCDAGNTQDAP